MKGIAVILSGPSGVGKDTVIDRWCELDQTVERVVACTTRKPRLGEVDGVAYHFMDPARFEELAEQGYFLEYKNVHGNYYGTPKIQLEDMVRAGKKAILKIDVQGALQVMQAQPGILSVFLLPPSRAELAQRLRNRGTESDEMLEQRLKNAEWEMDQAVHYRYRVINHSVDDCVAEIMRIVEKECRMSS